MARGSNPYYSSGKLADPEFRRARASKAARAAHSVDAHIRAIINAAPALTAEQAAKLRALLPPTDLRPEPDLREAG